MRWLNGVFTSVLFILLISAGAVIWFNQQVQTAGPLSAETLVAIPAGKGERAIAQLLEDKGVVTSRHVFLAHQLTHRIWERLQNRKPQTLKAGEYRIKPASSVRQVAELIRSGKSDLISVSIPEGLTSYQIVQRLIANEALTGDVSDIPPEGFLMPDTYRVLRNTDRKKILEMMATEQRKYLRRSWQARQPDLPLKDISEALILASIVEKETGPKDDPARIAAVFINRLRKGMRLQSDPTILYGKHGTRVAWGSTIYRSDIQKKTSHNTYQIDGLPPTPICNPGRASLEAVLKPARTKELYFVANGEGGHIFSETVEQHNRAVAQWRKIEKRIRAAEKAKVANQAKVAAANSSTTAVATVTPQTTTGSVQQTTRTLKAPDGTPIPERRPAR